MENIPNIQNGEQHGVQNAEQNLDFLFADERLTKLRKVETFGWRDIVLLLTYFILMFIVPFMVTLVIMLLFNRGDVNAMMRPETLLSITLWSLMISGVINSTLVISFYWRIIADSWKRFWKKGLRNIGYIILGYIVILAFNILFSTFVSSETSTNQTMLEEMFSQASKLDMLMLQLSVVIFAPLVEEFLCRKTMFGSFKDKKGWNIVMFFVSSIIFGLLHYGFDYNFLALVPYVFMGMVMAAVYWKTDNIFTAIGLHFFNNGLAAILILFL